MKRLLALSVFGLVLGLALTQMGTAEAKEGRGSDDRHEYGVRRLTGCNTGFVLDDGKCKPLSGEIDDDDDDDDNHRRLTGCNSGFVLKDGKCKSLTGEMMKHRKIRRNEFNDDLNKVLKFLNKKAWKKENKKIIAKIISQTRKDVKAIYKQMKTEYLSGIALDLTGYVAKLTAEFTGFKADLTPYINTGAQIKLNTYIDAKIRIVNNLLTRTNKKK